MFDLKGKVAITRGRIAPAPPTSRRRVSHVTPRLPGMVQIFRGCSRALRSVTIEGSGGCQVRLLDRTVVVLAYVVVWGSIIWSAWRLP